MNVINKCITMNRSILSIPSFGRDLNALRSTTFCSQSRTYHWWSITNSVTCNDDKDCSHCSPTGAKLHAKSSALFTTLRNSKALTSYHLRRNSTSSGSARFKSTVDESSPSKRKSQNDPSSQDSVDSSDPLSRSQKAKEVVKKGAFSMQDVVKKYGWTFIGTYLGVYFTTLGSLFIAIDSGAVDPITITNIELPWHSSGADNAADKEEFDSAVEFISSYMKKFPWTAPYADVALKNPHMTNLALAWIAVKFTEPIRLPISIGIVRKISKNKDE